MDKDKEEFVSRRFDYVKYDERAAAQQANFKEAFQTMEELVETLHDGRAKSLAMTHLEIAYMWVGKALRDECIARNGAIPDVPERTNE